MRKLHHDNPLLHFHDEAGMEAGFSRNERSGSSRSGWSGPDNIDAGGVKKQEENNVSILEKEKRSGRSNFCRKHKHFH
jgi:hypothetical protein